MPEREPLTSGAAAFWLGTMSLLATAALYLWPLAGPGAWISGDSPFHLALVHAVEENLKGGRGLWGWSNHDLGGFPVFSLFAPSALGPLAVVVAGLVTPVSMAAGYKLLVGLAVLLPALSVWLALSRRVSGGIALLAASLSLLLTYHVVQPLNGAWGPYLAAGLLLLCVSAGERWLREGPTLGGSLAILALASAAALSDTSAWPALACATIALSVAYRAHAGSLRLGAWATLALCPLVLWLALLTWARGVGWGLGPETPPSLGEVVLRLPAWFLLPGSGQLLSGDLLPAVRSSEWGAAALHAGRLVVEHFPEFAVLALAVVGARRILGGRFEMPDDLRRFGAATLLLIALLLVAILLPRRVGGGWWGASAWAASPERLVPYVNLGLLVTGALGLSALRSRRAGRPSYRAVIAVALALVLAHGVRYATYGDHVLLKTADQSVIQAELGQVWGYLRSQVAGKPTRVLYETLEGVGFLDGGPAKLTALSAVATGVPALASWRLPTLASIRRPPLLSGDYPLRPLTALPDAMRRWNCGYVVVWWPGTRDTLRASSAFEVVHESPNRLFTVLRLRDYEPSWLEFERPVRRITGVQALRAGTLRLSVDNPWEGNRGVLKMTYHPGWRLWVNGRATVPVAVNQQIGTGPLPAGALDLIFSFGRPI